MQNRHGSHFPREGSKMNSNFRIGRGNEEIVVREAEITMVMHWTVVIV
jgi:hypothetical protein